MNSYPNNRDKFIRLIDFLTKILCVCKKINVDPVLDGSLAAFLYSGNENIVVNDIDFSYSEKYFPKIKNALKTLGFDAQIKEWHVLQVRKNDLKVEFGDTDY